jgi:hypothetical protein
LTSGFCIDSVIVVLPDASAPPEWDEQAPRPAERVAAATAVMTTRLVGPILRDEMDTFISFDERGGFGRLRWGATGAHPG